MPVVTAKMVSSLDALSGGRVVLGIGAGWVAEESAMLGVPFDERGPMTDEYMAAMRELWTSPAPSFAGKYTQFSELHFEPKPVQKPHPPIWVGGHARASLRRAAEIGAAWHPINRSVEELRAGRAELAAALRGARPRGASRGDLAQRHLRVASGPARPGALSTAAACWRGSRLRWWTRSASWAPLASSIWCSSSWRPTALTSTSR